MRSRFGRICSPVILVTCFTAACQTAHRDPGQATVVVFAPGSHWRGTGDQFKHLLFGEANERSFGEFFDGEQRVALLTHSHYLVLDLPAGKHTFSAGTSKKRPNDKQRLEIEMLPASVRFLAITATLKNWGAGIIATESIHIAEASCLDFQQDIAANKSEPVPMKRVSESYRNQVTGLASLPECASGRGGGNMP